MSIVKTLLLNDDEWEPIDRKEKKEKIAHPCPSCGSFITKEILDHTPSLQYSWVYCGTCEKLLYQGQNPAITKACEVRDRQIVFILDNFDLSEKEQKFLNDRLYERFATVKQREWLDRIAVKTLEHPFDWGAYEK